MAKRKRKKKKRKVAPVVEPQPKASPADTTCFISYSVGCIALQKVTFELENYWRNDKIPMVVFDQNIFDQVLTESWKTIVLHRGGTHNWSAEKTHQFMLLLKQRQEQGTKLVYYIDDFLMHQNNNLPIHLMRMCDTVIAKGYFLPEYLRKSEGLTNVKELKTWIDLEKFDDEEVRPAPYKYPLNVLWFSAGRTGLGFVTELFKHLNPAEWKEAEWQIIGTGAALYRAKLNQYRGLNKYYCEKVPLEVLYGLTKGADIVINPLHPQTDNQELAKLPYHKEAFNDAKVEIKFIIAGAGSKPLLTCESEAYRHCIEHGQNGYMTNDVQEWVEILRKLKDSKELREKIGQRARADVEAGYDAKDRWPVIKKLLYLEA